jgi:flagellar hook-basal body complex protein FliE
MQISPNEAAPIIGLATKQVDGKKQDVDGFANEMKSFIAKVEKRQVDADHEVRRLASGEGNIHETAMALEKADITVRLLLKGRDKIVQAYQEVMRMPL